MNRSYRKKVNIFLVLLMIFSILISPMSTISTKATDTENQIETSEEASTSTTATSIETQTNEQTPEAVKTDDNVQEAEDSITDTTSSDTQLLEEVPTNDQNATDVQSGGTDTQEQDLMVEESQNVEVPQGIESPMWLTVENLGEESLTISWSVDGYEPESFNIYLNGELQKNVPATEKNYQITNLKPSTTYYVNVEAMSNNKVISSPVMEVKTGGVPEPSGVQIEFADPNLKQVIQEQLGIDRDIYESDMEMLYNIHAYGRDIKSLEGLDAAKNLVSLYLSNNSITDITPVKNLSQLQFVNLSNNPITDISVLTELSQLTKVELVGVVRNDQIMNSIHELQKNGVIVTYAELYWYTTNTDTSISLSFQSDDTILDKLQIYLNGELQSEEVIEQPSNEVDWQSYTIRDLTPEKDYPFEIVGLDKEGNIVVKESNQVKTNPAPSGEVITFEDENIKQQIQEQLFLDREIYQSDVENIKYLDLSGKQITSIKGLEHLTKLQSLNLNGNQIKDLTPLKGLIDLQYLDVSYNNLSSFDGIVLPNLTNLILRDNKITDISFLKNLPNLEYVDLDNNEASTVPDLSSLENLDTLWLNGNPLSGTETIENIAKLLDKDMEVYYSLKDEEPVFKYYEPTAISENSISMEWQIGNNSVASYQVFRNKELVDTIDDPKKMDYTLTDLAPATEYTIKVKALNDKGITLGVADFVATTLADPSTGERGELIQFKDSKLKEAIQQELRINGEIYSNDLLQIYGLNVYDRGIEDLTGLKYAKNLQYLDLSHNQISRIDELKELSQLEYLALWDNQIEDIQPIQSLTNLVYLDLDTNKVEDLSPLKNVKNLEVIWLANNPIEDVSILKDHSKIVSLFLYGVDLDLSVDSINAKILKGFIDSGVGVYTDNTEFTPILNFTSDVVTHNSASFSWSVDGYNNVDSYHLYVDDKEVANIEAGSTNSYTIKDLEPNTDYSVSIQAFNGETLILGSSDYIRTKRAPDQLKEVNILLQDKSEEIPTQSLEYSIEGIDEENSDIFQYGYMKEDGLLSTWYTTDGKLNLPEGNYQLVIFQNGQYLDTLKEFEVELDTDYQKNPIRITVNQLEQKTTDFTVHILDQDKNAITNVDYVSLYSSQASATNPSVGYYWSEQKDGNEITFKDVQYASDYQLYVSAKGYIDFNQSEITIDEENKVLNVQLEEGKKVRGTVTDTEGKPLAANYYVYGTSSYKYGTTDAGEFEISGLNPEDIKIEISMPGYETKTLTVKEEDLDTNNVDLGNIQLVSEKYVHGHIVTEDGTPAKNVYVYLYNNENQDQWSNYWARTDADGYFKIRNVTEDAYVLKTDSYDHPEVEMNNVTPKNEEYHIILAEEGEGSFFGEGNSFSASKSVVTLGKSLDYRLDYKNNGNAEANDVKMTLSLAPEVDVIAESFLLNDQPIDVRVVGDTITIPIKKVEPGEKGKLTFQTNVKEDANKMIASTAKITLGENENTLSATSNLLFVTLNAPEMTAKQDVKVYGNAKPGSTVKIYAGDVKLSETTVDSRWWYSDIKLPIDANDKESSYQIVAKVSDGGNTYISQPVTIQYKPDIPKMTDVTIDAGWNKGVKLNPHTGVATMAITEFTPIELNVQFDKGIENGKVYFLGEEYSLIKDGDGYKVEIPGTWSSYGEQLFEIEYATQDGIKVKLPLLEVIVLIDPSGYVFEGSMDNPVEGVQAVVQENVNGAWKQWDATFYGQINPQITDKKGRYGWDVLQGDWRVIFSKTGYDNYISRTVTVPPQETQLNVPLVRSTKPSVKLITPSDQAKDVPTDSFITVQFDRLMNEKDFNDHIQVVAQDGSVVNGQFELQGYNGYKEIQGKLGYFEEDTTKKLSQTFVWTPSEELDPDTIYQIKVSGLMEDYAGKALGQDVAYTFKTIQKNEEQPTPDDQQSEDKQGETVLPEENQSKEDHPSQTDDQTKDEQSSDTKTDNLSQAENQSNTNQSESEQDVDDPSVVYVSSPKNNEIQSIEHQGKLEVKLANRNENIIKISPEQVALLKVKGVRLVLSNNDVQLVINSADLPIGKDTVEIKIKKMKDIKNALSTVYDFSIIQGKTIISQFSKPVQLTFNVDQLKVNDPSKVKVYYYNESKKVWEVIGGQYKDGKIVAETNHFSTYAVFESTSIDQTEQPENILPKTATNNYNLIVIGVLFGIAGAVLFLYRRKRA